MVTVTGKMGIPNASLETSALKIQGQIAFFFVVIFSSFLRSQLGVMLMCESVSESRW